MDILTTLDSMGVKRRGRKISCQNNHDSSFSLHIYDDGAKCFSCGASYSHRQLLSLLGGGRHVPFNDTFQREKAERKFRNALLKSERVKIFSDFYRLCENSSKTKSYLSNRRGINKDLISYYGVKFISNPKSISQTLRQRYDKETLIKSGLFGVSKREFFYFSFFEKNSIVFPFFDKKNRPVYFQTRSLEGKTFLKPTGMVEHHFFYGNIFSMQLYVFESIIDCLSYQTLTGKNNFVALNTLNVKNIVDLHKRFPDKKLVVVPDFDCAGTTVYNHIDNNSKTDKIQAMSLPDLLKKIDKENYAETLSKLDLEFDLNDYLIKRGNDEKKRNNAF